MSKVTFHYNLEKDAWSWVSIAKDKDFWGLNWENQVAFIPDELLREIIKRNPKDAELLVRRHLITHPKKSLRQLVIKNQIEAIKKSWGKIETKFFKRIEQVFQKPIPIGTLKGYVTSGFMCPDKVKEKWFMISMWHSIPMNLTIICHELIHLQFLYHYEEYCRKFLDEKQTEDLKEALTFILNTNFSNLILIKDKGYPAHQKLRKKLEKIWVERKNFQDFLDKAIKAVKSEKTC